MRNRVELPPVRDPYMDVSNGVSWSATRSAANTKPKLSDRREEVGLGERSVKQRAFATVGQQFVEQEHRGWVYSLDGLQIVGERRQIRANDRDTFDEIGHVKTMTATVNGGGGAQRHGSGVAAASRAGTALHAGHRGDMPERWDGYAAPQKGTQVHMRCQHQNHRRDHGNQRHGDADRTRAEQRTGQERGGYAPASPG